MISVNAIWISVMITVIPVVSAIEGPNMLFCSYFTLAVRRVKPKSDMGWWWVRLMASFMNCSFFIFISHIVLQFPTIINSDSDLD